MSKVLLMRRSFCVAATREGAQAEAQAGGERDCRVKRAMFGVF